MNSVNARREGDEGRNKKEEKRDKMNGGPKFGPHIKVRHGKTGGLGQVNRVCGSIGSQVKTGHF